MIYGVGTDLIRIDRIRVAQARNGGRFERRILGPDELAIFQHRSARRPDRGIAFLATRFAAKEAISKAIGLGMRHPMSWQAVQILNAPGGRPIAVANGELAQWLGAQSLTVQVSITDEAEFAAAFAVASRQVS